MTDAGTALHATAIFKIEKGDPPRRITVDELVGFARVFETNVDDLLAPPELVAQQRARELVGELDRSIQSLTETTTQLVNMYSEYFDLAAISPAAYEFVTEAWFGPDDDGRGVRPTPIGQFIGLDGKPFAEDAMEKLQQVVQNYIRGIIDVAGDATEANLTRLKRRMTNRGRKNGARK
jgi:hypothetical protein